MSHLRLLVFALVVIGGPSWCAAQDPPQPVYFTRGFQFEEVDVSRVAAQLRSFGIPVPVALRGTATVDLSVSIPLNRLTDGRAYRVQGTLQSPALQVDRFHLGELTAALTIENGRLSLTGVEGQFLEPVDPAGRPAGADAAGAGAAGAVPLPVLGSFAGEATAELLPLGQFRADLRVENLDVRFFDPFLAEPIPELAGAVDGVVELNAPVERIGEGVAYTATATLQAERFHYAELALADASANLRLSQGTVELTSLVGHLQTGPPQRIAPPTDSPPPAGGLGRGAASGPNVADRSRGVVQGTATAELIPLGQLAVQVEIEQFDLSLLELLAEAPTRRLGGEADLVLDLSAAIANAAELDAWTGSGEFSLERLVIQPAAGEVQVIESQPAGGRAQVAGSAPAWGVESARGEFELAAGTFSIDPIRVDLDGVPLHGSAAIRLTETPEQERGWSAAVRAEAVEVAELVEWGVGAAPEETTGTVSFDVKASGALLSETVGGDPEGAADGVASAGWQVAGTIAGSEIHVAGFRVGALAHQLQLSPESLSLEPVADAPDGTLLLHTLRADYRADDQTLRLQNLSLQGWDGQLSGEATWSLIASGQHRAVLDWSGFEFTLTTFQAETSGEIQWTAPADQLRHPAAHRFNVRASLADLRRDDRTLGDLEVSLDGRQIPWQLRGSGQLFEVPAVVSASVEIPATVVWEDLPRVPGSGSLVAGPFSLQPLLDRVSPKNEGARNDGGGNDGGGEEGGDAMVQEASLRGTGAVRIDAVATGDGPPQMTAELAIEELGYGNRTIADAFVAATDLQVLDGRLRLVDLRGELRGTDVATPPLQFSGLAVAEFAPLGQLAFEMATEAVDLAWFNPWLPDGMGPFDGTVAGTLQASVPFAEISRVAAWKGTGDVESPQWRMGDLSIRRSSAELVLHEAVLRVDRIHGIVNGVALAGSAAVELETDRKPGGTWEARLQTGNADAANVFALFGVTPPDETSGFVSFDVDAAGRAAEPGQESWRASGELSADALRIAGVEIGQLRHHLRLSSQQVRLEPLPATDLSRLRLTRLAADYREEEVGYRLRYLRFEGWGGTLSGNAFWSRDPEQRHRIEIDWSDLRLPVPLPEIGFAVGDQEDAALQMLTAGSLDWSAAPDALTRPSAHQFSLRTEVRELRAGTVELGELVVRIDAQDPNWEVRGEGTLLGGPAELTAAIDVGQAESWDAISGAPADGSLAVGPMQLDHLFHLWQPPEGAEGWSGVAALQWVFSSDGQEPPESFATLRIENLAYRDQSLTDRLEVELASRGGELDIRSLRGAYAGGRIEGSGRWTAGPGPRQLVVRLSSLDASRALLPVVATSGEWFGGRLSADLVISGRSTPRVTEGVQAAASLRVNGRMELRNGETFGLQSRSLRARVRGAVHLPSLRWSLQLADLQASRGRGRVVGHVRLDQSRVRSDRVDLDSHFEATDLDFQEVLAELGDGGPPTFGNGSLTGTATLRGQAIESFADLEGQIVGRLGGTDATAVPGLLAAQNYLGVLSLRGTEFNRGTLEARLRQGELQILEFWLASDQLRIWADGKVSLRSGRLDINAVAATGDFQASNPAILALARTVALDAALPISVLTRANELLSNRVVNLTLTGTYRRPVVRIRPVAMLTRNAARFFLREAAGVLTEY